MLYKIAGQNTRNTSDSAKRKILVVVHQQRSSPGRIGRWLCTHGFQLDIRRPPLGDSLPETLEDYYGAVIFGGPMSANDNEEYIRREIDWINVPLKENKPFLGVCLGAQMMAKTLGGTVWEHPEGNVEIGYYPIRPTQAGRAVVEWPDFVYQWHREGFDLPRDATLLATNDIFENQAFVLGDRAFGVQFHAELTLAMMHRWTIHGRHRLDLKGAQSRDAHFAGRNLYDDPLNAWLDGFLRHWSAL